MPKGLYFENFKTNALSVINTISSQIVWLIGGKLYAIAFALPILPFGKKVLNSFGLLRFLKWVNTCNKTGDETLSEIFENVLIISFGLSVRRISLSNFLANSPGLDFNRAVRLDISFSISPLEIYFCVQTGVIFHLNVSICFCIEAYLLLWNQ